MPPELYDFVIIGAGISGIGVAYYIKHNLPSTKFIILDDQSECGGTWNRFNYPGIRTDSEASLYSYEFREMITTESSYASGSDVKSYLENITVDGDLIENLKLKSKLTKAVWTKNKWTLYIEGKPSVETRFLVMCNGYYDHHKFYTPNWKGLEQYTGKIVHPYTWDKSLDYNDKNVTIIGSGTTAIGLVTELAKRAKHINLIQRSPGYYCIGRTNFGIKTFEELRTQIITSYGSYLNKIYSEPEVIKHNLLQRVKGCLKDNEQFEKHFIPNYNPLIKRMAFLPDETFFSLINNKKVTMITDEIDHFDEHNINLKSGIKINSDIVITATGFNIGIMNGIEFIIDDKQVDFSKTIIYRNMMFDKIPNLVWLFGYYHGTWSLRIKVISEFIIRLLQHMKSNGYQKANIEYTGSGKILPWIDQNKFNPGYIQRNIDHMPKRVNDPDWLHEHDFATDLRSIPNIDLNSYWFKYE